MEKVKRFGKACWTFIRPTIIFFGIPFIIVWVMFKMFMSSRRAEQEIRDAAEGEKKKVRDMVRRKAAKELRDDILRRL
jgi:hypothetical protein